jgi:hypothetical protein
MVTQNIKDKAQVVAFFLNIIENKLINTVTIEDFIEPFSDSEFRKIMAHNFMKGELNKDRDKITYSQYNTWIKICYKLFSEFSKCPDLFPGKLGQDSTIRFEFTTIIRNFASKLIQFSVEQAKSSQTSFYDLKNNYGDSSNEDISAVHKKFEKMKKWDAKGNLIPFITNGKFMIFYGDDSLFKDQ